MLKDLTWHPFLTELCQRRSFLSPHALLITDFTYFNQFSLFSISNMSYRQKWISVKKKQKRTNKNKKNPYLLLSRLWVQCKRWLKCRNTSIQNNVICHFSWFCTYQYLHHYCFEWIQRKHYLDDSINRNDTMLLKRVRILVWCKHDLSSHAKNAIWPQMSKCRLRLPCFIFALWTKMQVYTKRSIKIWKMYASFKNLIMNSNYDRTLERND